MTDLPEFTWKAGMTDGDLIVAAEHCRRQAVFHNRVGTSAQAEAYAEAGRRFQAELLDREHAMEELWRETELNREEDLWREMGNDG